MKYTALIAIAFLALAGCTTAEVIDPGDVGPVTQVVTVPEIIKPIAVKETTVSAEGNVTQFIPIGTLLEKLIASGCVIDTLKYREIEDAS